MRHLVASSLSTAAVIAGPVLLHAGFRWLRIHRLVDDTPLSRIRSMAMGLVELNGAVAERSRVTAPFSGRPCAFWEVEIATCSAASRSRGYVARQWTTVHRNHSGHPFYLTDETGTALVYPQGADVRLEFGVDEETGGLGVPEPYHGYMEQQGLAMRGVWALGPMRFRERILEDGTAVYVLGHAYPRPQATVIAEGDEALEATGTEAVGAYRVRTRDQEVRGVVRRGPEDPVYVISPRSEKATSFEYGFKAAAALAGAPLVTIFGVWCLLELARSGQLFR